MNNHLEKNKIWKVCNEIISINCVLLNQILKILKLKIIKLKENHIFNQSKKLIQI